MEIETVNELIDVLSKLDGTMKVTGLDDSNIGLIKVVENGKQVQIIMDRDMYDDRFDEHDDAKPATEVIYVSPNFQQYTDYKTGKWKPEYIKDEYDDPPIPGMKDDDCSCGCDCGGNCQCGGDDDDGDVKYSGKFDIIVPDEVIKCQNNPADFYDDYPYTTVGNIGIYIQDSSYTSNGCIDDGYCKGLQNELHTIVPNMNCLSEGFFEISTRDAITLSTHANAIYEWDDNSGCIGKQMSVQDFQNLVSKY